MAALTNEYIAANIRTQIQTLQELLERLQNADIKATDTLLIIRVTENRLHSLRESLLSEA